MSSIFLLITFTTSFATMSYVMITASIMSDFTGEEILSQCLTMGPYLLGLGFGSIFGDKIEIKNALKIIWQVEWVSVLILPLIPLIHVTAVFIYLHYSPLDVNLESKRTLVFVLSLAGALAFATGLLGGSQLPLIIKLIKERFKSEIVLAINYMGPLLAGPFVIFCNQASLPASVQIGIVAMIQLSGLILLLVTIKDRIKQMLLLTLPLVIIIGVNKSYPPMEFYLVKASYLGTKLEEISIKGFKTLFSTLDKFGDLERIRTSYQVIDFFTIPPIPEFLSPENSTLYLNRKTQFDLYAVDLYHESMIYGGLNLLESPPERVLILGAGDGLLLKELKNIPEIKHVDMVELDPGIIDYATRNPVLSRLNENIFLNPGKRFNIIVGDAISYLRHAPSDLKYDLVLIDFPFPNGHELSKLYSKELYLLVKRVMRPETLVVIDLPIQRTPEEELTLETRVILKTLHASGFTNLLPFGPVASFIAAKQEGTPLEFNYEKFPPHVTLPARLNLIRVTDDQEMQKVFEKTPLNSMFWPRGL